MEKRMRLEIVALLLAFSAPVLAQDATDQVVRVDGADQEMNGAIAEARATLDQFLALARHPPRGAENFKLKVMFSDSHGVEHMWVTPFELEGDGFKGTLANEPKTVRSIHARQTVHFKRSDVTDWGYELGGKQVGSFTVCVLIKHMPVAQARSYQAYGFDCQASQSSKPAPLHGST
jgi:uncharacterized protein YegJ (DUF2314 family)